MYAKILAAGCAALFLTGCEGRSGQSLPPDDHPASPHAAIAPSPDPSTTLAAAPGGQTRPEAASSAQPHSHDHGTAAPATAPADRTATVYVCPHHPEVTSTNPNDRCPKCNMKLVLKEGQ